MAMRQPRPKWVPPVPPGSAVGTGHRFGEPVDMEGVHHGVDVQAVRGTPALSPVSGTVTRTWNEPQGLGQQIGVRGPDGNEVRFAHLEGTQARPGQRVGAGEQIATVGSSGAGSTGAHLDLRLVTPQGQFLDPTRQLGPMAQMPRADKAPIGAGQAPSYPSGGIPTNGFLDALTGEWHPPGSAPPGGNAVLIPVTPENLAMFHWGSPPLQDTLAGPGLPPQNINANNAMDWASDPAFTNQHWDYLNTLDHDHYSRPINPWTQRGIDSAEEAMRVYLNRASAPQLAPSQQYPESPYPRSWTERGFRFMPESTEPITLYRGMYPNVQHDPMGNYGGTTQANEPGPAGSYGAAGAWYTDDPQLAASMYATNGRTAPQTNAEWQRLIPGMRSMMEHPAAAWSPDSAPQGMDPGWMGALQVPANRVRDLLWRTSGDYLPNNQYRDPANYQPGMPREFIVPQDLLPQTRTRFVSGVPVGGMPGMAAQFPEQFMQNLIEPGMRAVGEWFNPPPAGGDLYPDVPLSPSGSPQVYDTPGWDDRPREPAVGGGQDVRTDVGVGQGQFVSPLAGGGIFGAQKWSSGMGSNATDIFVRRGSPVFAPVSGTLQQGANGQLMLIGDNGWNFAFRHGQTTAQGHVEAGRQIGIVNDPGLDSLGQAPWGNMPDGYQHLELSVSQGSPDFPGIPGGGGNVDAAQWLNSIGYQGSEIGKTPGPPDAMGGGGMGGGMGGFGGGMFGGMGGMGGFPGMGGGMGMGDPMSMMMGGMGGMGGGLGGGMGMGMGGMGGMMGGMGGSPFGGGMGGGMGGLGSMGMGSPMSSFGGGSPSFSPDMSAGMTSTPPAGQTGVPMPDIKPLDMTTMTKLDRPDNPTPWLDNHQALTSVEHTPTDFSALQPPPVIGQLGTQPYQTPFWLQPPPQKQPGAGQDVGVGAGLSRPRMSTPMFMAPRHGLLPMDGAEQTFQMMQPGHAEVNPPAMPRPRGGMGGGFRAPRPRFGRGQDVGVGQNSITAGTSQGAALNTTNLSSPAASTTGSSAAQVMIDPFSAQQLQQEQQRLQLSQSQINGQLQQINDNYQLALKKLQQDFQLTGDSNKLEQDRQRLQDQQFHDTQGLQMRLANVQTQQNALDRYLRQQEINNNFQTAQGQLQQQWMGHQDDALFQRQQLGLQNAWQQQSNALALTQTNKNAQLQLELQKGTLGFQQEQLGVNAGLSLEQLAAQTGLSQEQLRAQTGLGIMSLGQQAADQAANRQLSLYNSALQNPWVQQLAGLSPEYNAPGGPGETGWASAHGMQARADMNTLLPNGQVPDWYARIGQTQVNQHPDYLNKIGQTQVNTNPDWLSGSNQNYFDLIKGIDPTAGLGMGNFTGNYQNTWNSNYGIPNTTGLNQTTGVNTNGLEPWSPFQPQALSTSGTPNSTTGGTNSGSNTMPQFGLAFDPAGGGTMQQRPAGQNSGVTYTLPGGQTFSSQDVWDWEQANQGSSPDQAYQHFISQNPSYQGWNYGTNFPLGSTVQWNKMPGAQAAPSMMTPNTPSAIADPASELTGTQGMDSTMFGAMQAPGQSQPSVGQLTPNNPWGNVGNYVGTGQDDLADSWGGDATDPRMGEYRSGAEPQDWNHLPPAMPRAGIPGWLQERSNRYNIPTETINPDFEQRAIPIPLHNESPWFDQDYPGEASGDSGWQHLGYLPAEHLAALKADPSRGAEIVEGWLASRRQPVGSGADVPFVQPFENPAWRLDNSYVGSGADYNPLTAPIGSTSNPTASYDQYGGSGAGSMSMATNQSNGGSIQNSMNQAFGGNDQRYGGLTSGDYTNWGMGPVQQGGGYGTSYQGGYGTQNYDAPNRLQQGYNGQNYTPPTDQGSDWGMPQGSNTYQNNPQTEGTWTDPSSGIVYTNAVGTPPVNTYQNWQGTLPNNGQGAVPSNEQQGVDPATWYGGWRDHFGSTDSNDPYDINHDNLVDIRDWGLYQQQGNNIHLPPNTNPTNLFQTPLNTGQQGYVPGQLMKPPPVPAIPDWQSMKAMTPFERAAFMAKVQMSGIPWPQFQDAMRAKWGQPNNPGPNATPGVTQTPDQSILAYLNARRDPMLMTDLNQRSDLFGEGSQAYWQRMNNLYAPGQSSGAMISS